MATGRRALTAARVFVLGAYGAALVLPAYVFFHDRGTGFLTGVHGRALLQAFFPLIGLYAFTFVTAQVLLATNLTWLSRLWPRVIQFHRAQGAFALAFALLHPAAILVGYSLATIAANEFIRDPALSDWLIPAYIGLAILVFTVMTALLAWSGRRISWWRRVHRLNYLAFGLVWLHSWFIGTDTQTPLLRRVWIGYLALAILSVSVRQFAVRRGVRARCRARRTRPAE